MATETNSQVNDTTNTTTETTTTTEEVTFTPAQQSKIDQIIKDRMTRAKSEALAEAERLRKENEALKKTQKTESTESGDPDAKELKRIADQRKLEAEQARREADQARKDLDVAKSETRTVQKRIELRDAASKQDFVDSNDVIALTERFVKWDESNSKWMVVNEDGEPRYNLAYQPMSVEEFFSDYAQKKPHLVRSGVKPGAGSSSNQSTTAKSKHELTDIFGSKSDAGKANRLAKENPAEYKRLRQQAVDAGLLRR